MTSNTYWRRKYGYLVCVHFGFGLLTILRRSKWNDLFPSDPFIGFCINISRDATYIRFLSAELTVCY